MGIAQYVSGELVLCRRALQVVVVRLLFIDS